MSNLIQQSKNHIDWLENKDFENRISPILPTHLRFDKFVQIAKTELKRNPDLMRCTPQSFMGAIIKSFSLGLEPGGVLGLSHLIPFFNRRANSYECQFIIGYKGMLDLAWRSGKINGIQCQVVYENDEFDYEYGLSPRLSHKPSSVDRGELKYVYCCILLTSGGHIFEVMSKDEIDAIKKSSAGASRSDSPWNSHYKSMAKKSVIRQLFRLLPISTELATAIDYDERASDGGQFNSQVINTIFPEENFEQQKLVQQTAEAVLDKVDTKSKAQRIAEKAAG